MTTLTEITDKFIGE